MGLDLLIACLVMIVLEYAILKEKYILLSPYFLFNISFLYIYILPIVTYGKGNSINYINRLAPELVSNLTNNLRLFYYIFVLLTLYSWYKLRYNHSISKTNIETIRLRKQTAYISVFFLFLIYVVGTLIKVGFSPSTFLGLLFNPRAYTFLREGYGVINYVINVAQMMMGFIGVLFFMQNRNVSSFILLLFTAAFNVLGGSKTSLFVILIFIILYYQIVKKKVIKLSKVVFVSIIIIVVAVVSFYIMRGSKELNNINDILNFIIDYDQECYYSARVINDFQWSRDNWIIELRSLLLTPIPRGLFDSKGLYGFYHECWRPLYQANTVVYHTSTYGFVSEAHMLFGVLAPIVCAVGFDIFFKKLYKMFYKSTDIFRLFILGYLFTRVYFYTRSGFLAASNVWALIIFIAFGKILLSFLTRWNIKK